VARRVLDQVEDSPLDGALVALYLRRPVHVDRHGAAVARARHGLGCTPRQRAELHRFEPGRPGRPRARQDEQVHREPVESVDFLQRGVERPGELAPRLGSHASQLELATHDRDGRAQVVTGVVEEGALVLERGLDAGEELVEVACEVRELLPRFRDRQASSVPSRRDGGDLVGLFDEVAHGFEGGAGEEPARDRHDPGQEREADDEGLFEPVLGVDRLVE